MAIFTSIYLISVSLSLLAFLTTDIILSEPFKKRKDKCKIKKQKREENSLLIIGVIVPALNLLLSGILINDLINTLKASKKETNQGNLPDFKIKQEIETKEEKPQKLPTTREEKRRILNSTKNNLLCKDNPNEKPFTKSHGSRKMFYTLILFGLFIYLRKGSKLY